MLDATSEDSWIWGVSEFNSAIKKASKAMPCLLF
jgi:hypothetical protein